MAHDFCPHCESDSIRRFGKRYDGGQRWQCKECRKTFSECRPLHPVTGKLEKSKAILAIKCLLEGCSVRSTERLTGITKKSILRLMLRAAKGCQAVMDEKLTGLGLGNIQVDELWAFVWKKQKRVKHDDPKEWGDAYTFVGIDPETKLIPCFTIGKRDGKTALEFMSDLHSRLSDDCRPQLTTDGFSPYLAAVESTFAADVDFAQLIKLFKGDVETGRERYSPGASWPSLNR